MNIVLCLAHSIEEYDQVRLLSGLGYDVFSIGAYSDPANPGDDKRPPLPDVPDHPELREACWETRHAHRDDLSEVDGRDVIDWAKYDLPQTVLDWADVVIYHHFEHTWLVPHWARLRDSGKRIVWRTVGQSVENNERMMAPLVADGLEVIRYSPKERNLPGYAGETALIRFYKDPDDFGPWTGDVPAVFTHGQHVFQRSCDDDGTLKRPGQQFTNWSFWEAATHGLPGIPIGPGSDAIGVHGTGAVTTAKLYELLGRGRAYLYTGTQPASYTLGLIEAMMAGAPVISIGPSWHQIFPYGPQLFEGHEIARFGGPTPPDAHKHLRRLLADRSYREDLSTESRVRAIELFGRERVGREWREFLG